jgi:hypothetical protein
MTRLNHALVFSSAANPSSSLYLTWNIYAFADEPEWQLFSPDGTVLESWAADSPQSSLPMVLAPSGQAGAYLEDGTLHLWDNGAFSELPIPNDLEIGQLLWGATEVRFGTEYGALG